MKSKRSRKDRAMRTTNKVKNISHSRQHAECRIKINTQRTEDVYEVYRKLFDEFKRQNGL